MLTLSRMTCAAALLLCATIAPAVAAPAGVDTYSSDYWNELAVTPASYLMSGKCCADPCQKGGCCNGGGCHHCPPLSKHHLVLRHLAPLNCVYGSVGYHLRKKEFAKMMRLNNAAGVGPYGGAQYAGYGCRGYGSYYKPDLFYNYWTPPSECGGMTAGMYPSPHATPAPAIQTYYTYQPFLPHEFMYTHNRKYTRFYNDGAGKTTTYVHWHTEPTRRLWDRGIIGAVVHGFGGCHTCGHCAGLCAGGGCGGCASGHCGGKSCCGLPPHVQK